MSPFAPQYQIVSDLHLEDAHQAATLQDFPAPYRGKPMFFLLGDIGLAKDDGLFAFLRSLLEKRTRISIFLTSSETTSSTSSRCAMRSSDSEISKRKQKIISEDGLSC